MPSKSRSKTITRDPNWLGPAMLPCEILLEEFLKPLELGQLEAARRLGDLAQPPERDCIGQARHHRGYGASDSPASSRPRHCSVFAPPSRLGPAWAGLDALRPSKASESASNELRISQRGQRIHASRCARGQVGRHDRCTEQEECCSHQRRRIEGMHLVEESLQERRDHEGQRQAGGGSQSRQPHPFTHDHPTDVSGRGTERQSDANLGIALPHRGGNHSVQPDSGE